jgi:hypothetical protein
MKKLLTSLACAAVLGCTLTAGAQIVVRIGPPVDRVERVPPPPPEHRDWAWHAGYNRWDGRSYVWVPGYVFIEGHWRR